MKQYDAIIIGFGKAGKTLAAELSNRGWQVAVVEQSDEMYGGACPNVACIPTKTLIHESEISTLLYHNDFDKQSNMYRQAIARKNKLTSFLRENNYYNPQIEMFARFKMKSSFHKTKRII